MSEVDFTNDLGGFSHCNICGMPFYVENGRAFGYCIDGYWFDDEGSVGIMPEEYHSRYICTTCIDFAWDAVVRARRGDLTSRQDCGTMHQGTQGKGTQ